MTRNNLIELWRSEPFKNASHNQHISHFYFLGAKLSLTQPKEPPSSPQLSRIPRFGRRPSAITENDSPKVNLNSSLNVSFSGSPVRPRRPSAVSDSDTSKVNLNASLNNSFSSGLPVFSRRPSAQIESDIPKINLNNSFSSGRSSVSTSPRPSRSNSQANIHVSSQQPSNDSPNLGSPSLANSTSKRKLSVSDLNYSGDGRKSAGIRRRPSATDAGYVSVSGTSLVSSPSASHAESPGYSSPRRRPSVSLDADAAKREGVISFTPQIKTSPVTGKLNDFIFNAIKLPFRFFSRL